MKQILYLGTNPSHYPETVVHFPLIEIKPRPLLQHQMDDWPLFTHVLLSSQNAIPLIPGSLEGKVVIAVGKVTAENLSGAIVAPFAQQEGMIAALRLMNLDHAYVACIGSSGARGALLDFLQRRNVRHQLIILYDVVEKEGELPDLKTFDEIVFTSPSTVDAFFKRGKVTTQKVKAIGNVTKERLRTLMS